MVFNNGVHGSVGGQPTVGFNIDMPQIAVACGYASAQCVTTVDDLKRNFAANMTDGVSFIEVKVRAGNRADVGRPTSTPSQNKIAMMKFLREEPTTHD